MKKIIVQSRHHTESMRPYAQPWACISITSPRQAEADINTKNCVGILRLQFDDIANLAGWRNCECTLFTRDDAKLVLEFAQRVWPVADVLHVHCEAGISRSSATAAALSRIYFGDDKEFFVPPFRPNRLVYPTIIRVHNHHNNKRISTKGHYSAIHIW